jgi:anti-sigma factor RsiW
MHCRAVADRLSSYIDHALPAADAESVRLHLESCPACAAECQALKVAWEGVLEVPRIGPRGDLWPALERRLEREAPRGRQAWFAPPASWFLGWNAAPALATALIVLVGILLGARLGTLVVAERPAAAGSAIELQVPGSGLALDNFDGFFPGSLAEVVLRGPSPASPSTEGGAR